MSDCEICGKPGSSYRRNDADFILCAGHIAIAAQLPTAFWTRRFIRTTRRGGKFFQPGILPKRKEMPRCECGHAKGSHENQAGKCSEYVSYSDRCPCETFSPKK